MELVASTPEHNLRIRRELASNEIPSDLPLNNDNDNLAMLVLSIRAKASHQIRNILSCY